MQLQYYTQTIKNGHHTTWTDQNGKVFRRTIYDKIEIFYSYKDIVDNYVQRRDCKVVRDTISKNMLRQFLNRRKFIFEQDCLFETTGQNMGEFLWTDKNDFQVIQYYREASDTTLQITPVKNYKQIQHLDNLWVSHGLAQMMLFYFQFDVHQMFRIQDFYAHMNLSSHAIAKFVNKAHCDTPNELSVNE